MPIMFTFTFIEGADYNRIQSFFERFGWQNLGSTSYRYPPLGVNETAEDWFNKVIPALMLFRAYTLKKNKRKKAKLIRFTIDVQSSSGFNSATKFGSRPQSGDTIKLSNPSDKSFTESVLREWLSNIDYPYS